MFGMSQLTAKKRKRFKKFERFAESGPSGSPSGRCLRGPVVVIAFVLLLSGLPSPVFANDTPASMPLSLSGSSPNSPYLSSGPSYTLINTGCCDSAPQVFFDNSGNLVVPYERQINPAIAVIGGDPPQILSGPSVISNGGAPPGFAVMDSNDRVVITYASSGARPIVYRVVSPNGTVLVNETAIGNFSIGSGFVTEVQAAAVALAASGAFATVHTVVTNGSVAKLVFDVISTTGIPLMVDRIVYDDLQWNREPQLAYDPIHDEFALAWFGDSTGNHVMGIDANGTRTWGPKLLGTLGPYAVNLTIDATGNTYAIWAEGATIKLTKISPVGTVLSSGTTVISSSGTVSDPRASLMPDGNLLFVWADNASGVDTDIRAQVVAPANLQTVTPRASITTFGNGSSMPRAAFVNSTTAWVAWADSNVNSQDIAVARLDLHHAGFSLDTPLQNLTLWRGEPLDVLLVISSAVNETTSYQLEARFQSFRGSANWSASFINGSGTNASVAAAPPSSRLNQTLRFTAPINDPDGYGATVIVLVQDAHFAAAFVTLGIDITVLAGHRFSIDPSQTNLSQMAGASVLIPLNVTLAGTLAESSLPLSLLNTPPGGWTAAFQPALISGAPGTIVPVNLTVWIPSNATNVDLYCSRVRLANPSDLYSAASAGFCIRTLLQSTPSLTSTNLTLSISPGASVDSFWNLSNFGNSAGPLSCFVNAIDQLPSGWTYQGNPAALLLAGGQGAEARIGIAADLHAPGLLRLDLRFEGSCEGANSVSAAVLSLSVVEVHSVFWTVAGTALGTGPGQPAVFPLTVTNNGDVPEPLGAVATTLPAGWSADFSFTVNGDFVTAVPAYGSARAILTARPSNSTPAGSYIFSCVFSAGREPPFNTNLTVRLAKGYGIEVAFPTPPEMVNPRATWFLNVSIYHLGNTGDSYTLDVQVAAPEFWSWNADYNADSTNDMSSYAAGSLALDPFSTGTLSISISVPAAPAVRDVVISIRLGNANTGDHNLTAPVHVGLADLQIAFQSNLTGLVVPVLNATVAFQVSNQGDGSSTTSLVRAVLDGVTIGNWTLLPLGPGETRQFALGLNASAGAHTLVLDADPKGLPGGSSIYGFVFESQENNNRATLAFQVANSPAGPGPTHPQQTDSNSVSNLIVVAAVVVVVAGAFAIVLARRRRRP
jgi:hypothetical protein